MIRPEAMAFAQVICSKHKVKDVLATLANGRILHLVDSPQNEGLTLPYLLDETSQYRAEQLKQRAGELQKIFRMIDIPLPEPNRAAQTAAVSSRNPGLAEAILGQMEKPLLALAERFGQLKRSREHLMEVEAALAQWSFLDVPLRQVHQLRSARLYLLEPARARSEPELPLGTVGPMWVMDNLPGPQRLLVLTLRSRCQYLEEQAQRLGWRIVEPPPGQGTPAEEQELVREEAARLEGQIADVRRQVLGWANQMGTQLVEADLGLACLLQIYDWTQHLQATDSTAVIAGFVRKRDLSTLQSLLGQPEIGPVFLEVSEPEQKAEELGLDIPVDLANPRLLNPFEQLVRVYGLPRYGETDPSLILGLTYSLMFGFMFGDVGQGLVLALTGMLVAAGKIPIGFARQPGIRGFGHLLTLCGASAMVFGLLFGTVFGSEELIAPIWMHPMEHINPLLMTGLGFGAVFVSVGIALNLTNNWARRDRFEAVFGEFGVFSGLAYWGVLAGVGALLLGAAPWQQIAWLAAGISSGVFAFGHHYRWLAVRGEGKEGRSIMQTLLSLFDVGLRYVTNTVSFIRLSAFALAHGALGIAVYAIADGLRQLPLGQLWWLAAVVFGNLLVIGLEGLIVGIQTLRLEFYEFFSKFLSGEGKPFSPLVWPRA